MITFDTPYSGSLDLANFQIIEWSQAVRHHEKLLEIWGERQHVGSSSSAMGMAAYDQRPLPDFVIDSLTDINDVCAVLVNWGAANIADRIAYFASDDDLDDDAIPVTADSARDFLRFYGTLDSKGDASLACTPEGWIFAEWDFEDLRSAGVWFCGGGRALFAATDADGEYVRIDGGSEVGLLPVIMAKLVQSGLFTWYPDLQAITSSHHRTMSRDFLAVGSLRQTVAQRGRLFDSETANSLPNTLISQPIGWSTSTLLITTGRQTGLGR